MKSLFFWNKFNPRHQKLYKGMLVVLLLAMVAYIVAYFVADSAVVLWQTNASLEALPVTLDSFNRGLYTFRVEAETMFIKELFQASEVKVNLWAAQVYFGFSVIAYIVALAIITCLSRTWYFVGMLVFIFLLSTLNLDLLQLFGQQNKYPVAVIIGLYAALSYYFFSFNKNALLGTKMLTIAALTAGIGVVIYFQKSEVYPLLSIVNLGMTIPILLTVVFIIINSFEVVMLFLNLTAGSRSGIDKSRLRNFIIISLLYLSNLVLLLLKKMTIVDWDLVYINMFLLQLISTILGIWGYQKRAVLNNSIIPFAPLGALLYLCYAIVSLSTIAYAFITGNDPLVEAFEYAILLAHLCFGLLFFLYIVINFSFLFAKNISVYEIVYVPRRFPFFVVHTAGGLAAMSFIFKLNMYPYFLAMAGYFNMTGDYYQKLGDSLLSKEYYFTGVAYDRQNQRSNYSLATLYGLEDKQDKEQEFYAATLVKNPTNYAFINLANWYLKNDMLLQAMFTLQDGLKAHPQDPHIANNLGLLYAKTNVPDSTYYYLQIASDKLSNNGIAANNFAYQLSKDNLLKEADSIASRYENGFELKFQNNKVALYNLLHKYYIINKPYVPKSDSLSPFEYAFILNQGINEVLHNRINKTYSIDSLIKQSGNDIYSNGLTMLKALKYYYNNNKQDGIATLQALYDVTTNAHYAKILAVWYYEQEAYNKAYEMFKYTIEISGQESVLNCCMALCEANKYSEAKENLLQLANSKSKNIASIAANLTTIFEVSDLAEVSLWPDARKYQWIHFRKNNFNENRLSNLVATIDTAFYQNVAKAELINLYLNNGNINTAKELWKTIKDIPAENTFEKGMLNFTHLQLLTALKDWTKLEQNLKSIFLNSDKKNLLPYWEAKILESKNQVRKAEQKYLQASLAAPMNSEVLIATSQFLIRQNKSSAAYELLAGAVKQNNESVPLLQAYVQLAGELGFSNYASDVLNQLSLLMPKEDFEIYKKKISHLLL